jgi:predicted lipid carrier protein YhbT
MRGVQFLSDEWLSALDDAARARPSDADDPLRGVHVVIEQVITGGLRWRLVVDDGRCSVVRDGAAEPDVRLTSDRDTAVAIATGARAALDAFLAGDLVLGGDVRKLLEHRAALEALGDLFASVRSATVFG